MGITILIIMLLLYAANLNYSAGNEQISSKKDSVEKNTVDEIAPLIEEEVFPTYIIEAFISKENRVTAKMAIDYTNNLNYGLEVVKLLLPANILYNEPYIRVNEIKIQNKPAVYKLDTGHAMVKLPERLAPGEKISITMDFNTEVPIQGERFGYYLGVGMLSNWYPVIAPYDIKEKEWMEFHPSDFGDPYFFDSAFFKGHIRSSNNLQVISPFFPATESAERTIWFDSKLPIRDLTLVYGENFSMMQKKVDDTIVQYFYHKKRNFLDAAAESLQFYNEIYGRYPYERLVVADVPLQRLMGMEFSGMFFLSTRYRNIGEKTLAHEVAHQYWYGLVGSDQINEAWIDESLANYSAILFLENKYGFKTYQEEINKIKRKNIGSSSLLSLQEYPSKFAYREAVYEKPIMLWDELRNYGGKERVVSLLKSIQDKYHFRRISTEALFGEIKPKFKEQEIDYDF